MGTLTPIQKLDNAKALCALKASAGAALFGIGSVSNKLTLRLDDGVRVAFHIDRLEDVVAGIADVTSVLGVFHGGTLADVSDDGFTIRGIGEITVSIP
jgi:hypothetical protein